MAGLSPAEFWDLTPHEVALHIYGYGKRTYQQARISCDSARVVAKAFGAKVGKTPGYKDPLK